MTKSSSHYTMNVVICLIYSMSKWISTYSEPHPVLESCLQLLHFWESGPGAHCRRVHHFAPLLESLS
ncbi:hypothetical protein Gotur_030692 [Gossypium turneri]